MVQKIIICMLGEYVSTVRLHFNSTDLERFCSSVERSTWLMCSPPKACLQSASRVRLLVKQHSAVYFSSFLSSLCT